MVAEQLGRDAILIDLNPKYVEMQVKRIESVKPAEKTAPEIDGYEQLRLM